MAGVWPRRGRSLAGSQCIGLRSPWPRPPVLAPVLPASRGRGMAECRPCLGRIDGERLQQILRGVGIPCGEQGAGRPHHREELVGRGVTQTPASTIVSIQPYE